ncbi:TPA: hypothetical protein NOE04_006531 [Pseudomonas aeruginosa]|nr:hypothetical protein [Pseudomonas aeruginosa]
MTNELTDVRCPCGTEFPAESYDAGFIAGSGMCQNCDAALPPKDICTCPSGDGSLRHPCPAHPASVELAGVAANLTFINGRPAMCGCQVEYSSGGGEYSDVIYVTLCAKHSGSAILDLVATNRIALTPEYEGQWHADLYLDREIPLAKADGATPADAVLALMSAERIDPEQESVEQAGGDERDFQAKGAQEVPSPVSKEYDRHLISLLRKGEALPGRQEEAADEIERLRDWNDHLNNTVLPNILNPNFLMLMKGCERLLDLCTKDGKFIGVSLNDMKDVFDWMVTHARIAPDHAALAQPSQAIAAAPTYQFQSREIGESDWAPCDFRWYLYCSKSPEMDTRVVEVAAQPSPAQAEQAEAERPEVVAWRYGFSGGIVSDKACLDEWKSGGEYQSLMTVAQHERIVKAWIERWKAYIELSAKIAAQRDAADARLHEVATACATAEQERDAALAEVERLRQFERICEGLPQDAIDGGWTVQGIRCYAKRLEDQLKVALARVAELEKQEPVATIAKVPGEDWNGLHFYRDLQGMQPGTKLYAAPVAQAGQVPAAWYYDAPSQAEAAIIDIRGMWDEDECPAYEDVASALRRMLASAPGKEGL